MGHDKIKSSFLHRGVKVTADSLHVDEIVEGTIESRKLGGAFGNIRRDYSLAMSAQDHGSDA